MKIQCDACEKAPATVICCADEAALCGSCDMEIHAANKLASKHQRLLLNCLSDKLPRCDICQEKAAFIFCVEDRALFCRDCDELIHVAGSLSGDHQRFLATGIQVAVSSSCNKDVKNSHTDDPPPHHALKTPATTQPTPSSSLAQSAWDVDEFLQLSDYESSNKKESSVGFGELEWFTDIDLFNGQGNKGGLAAAAEVPQLPTSHSGIAAMFRSAKSHMPFKRQRIELLDEEYFTVPDLG